ncbi:MAG: Cytidylate kinase [Chlamydiae bacterium]|nr:Cytidylate kinase [Chlamydiota bacterium]
MIIVIDGPSGAGKSTLAKKLAKELGIAYFDTGAMYRSVCWYLMEKKVSLSDAKQIKESLKNFTFELRKEVGEFRFFVNNKDVSNLIRASEIDKNVSQVAAYPFIRESLVHLQEEFSQTEGGAIFEGRDMGTVVFPNAELKFFLVADPKVRAMRRYEQLKELYPNATYDLKEIEKSIIKRDEYDSNRTCSPLKKAQDAHLIDASDRSINAILQIMRTFVEEQRA